MAGPSQPPRARDFAELGEASAAGNLASVSSASSCGTNSSSFPSDEFVARDGVGKTCRDALSSERLDIPTLFSFDKSVAQLRGRSAPRSFAPPWQEVPRAATRLVVSAVCEP